MPPLVPLSYCSDFGDIIIRVMLKILTDVIRIIIFANYSRCYIENHLR
nr:MAG TPA: hypothetical protein [Microviridae sp.]